MTNTVVSLKRRIWQSDLEQARQSREKYERYRDQVSDYIQDVQQVCDEAHRQRTDIEQQLARLQRDMRSMSPAQRRRAEASQLSLKNWLEAESVLSGDAARNIDRCQRWLAHYKDLANIDMYNAGRDEQAVADEERKFQLAQARVASDQRKRRDSDYWQAKYYVPEPTSWGVAGRNWFGYGLGGSRRYSRYSGGSSGHISSGGGTTTMRARAR